MSTNGDTRSKVAVVAGSHRPNSQTGKTARFIVEVLRKELPSVRDAFLLDLGRTPLPLWSEDATGTVEWRSISRELATSESIVIVTPEWNGMAPPAIKNFFLFCDDKELSHKAGLLVSVSSGDGGSYPIAELRASSYKNTHFCYIPEHVIVQYAGSRLNGPEPESREDRYIRDRMRYALTLLVEYGRALTSVRNSGVINHEKYPHGM